MNDTLTARLLKHDLRRATRSVLLPLAPVAGFAAILAWHGLQYGVTTASSASVLLAVLVCGVAALSTGVILARHLPRLEQHPSP